MPGKKTGTQVTDPRRDEERQRNLLKQEHLERIELESQLQSRQTQEKIKEASRKQISEEQKRQEEEHRKKSSEEEQRRAREEEERKKRVDAELKRKLDDDKKRSEERRKKIEEERRKRQDEDHRHHQDRLRFHEEETSRLEQEKNDLLFRTANNDFSFLDKNQKPSFNLADEIDLLGGSEDDRSASGSERSEDRDESYERGSNYSEDEYNSNSHSQLHRLSPQRGRVDEHTDNVLDNIRRLTTSIKKQGRNDGVYILGQRIMRVHLDHTQKPRVTIGTNSYTIQEFVDKFERVETTRQKGLESALLMTKMMGLKNSPISI